MTVRLIVLLLACATLASAETREPIRLAITVDDLPWVGPLPPGDTAQQAIDRISAVLRVHDAPATGFVVCDRAQADDSALRTWIDWGNTLGNHSAAHRDLNTTPVDEWLADVAECDRFLEQYGAAHGSWFRFPLLHQGDTKEKRDEVASALDRMGLVNAHVTVDTSEWILTRAHATALVREDARLRHEVGEEFVRHITAAVRHADQVAHRKLGRAVPQVLLLHANTLVDDHLDRLLLALRNDGVEFIDLATALQDPAYERADGFAGRKGLSWLYRMEPASPGDVAWDDAEAEAIEARFSEALEARETAGADTGPGRISWQRLAPDAPAWLARLAALAANSERMRSLLVMHRGELIGETYFNGAGPETPVNLKSVTKTLVSSLVGVALHQGWIDSVDDPIGRYLPERYQQDSTKASITIRQLLTMASGLTPTGYGEVQRSDDWVATVLSRPVEPALRDHFRYDTPVLQLLSLVLEQASGRNLVQVANETLLEPLGSEIAYWRRDASDLPLGGNDAFLLPRGLIQLGELYRRGGSMNGQRLLDADFVQASITPQIQTGEPTINHGTLPVRGYGYLWWLLDIGNDDVYAALGHGGQILAISPARELVVLMTSRWPSASSTEHYHHLTAVLTEVLARYPLSAVPMTRR